jgi:hypothetical protein
MNKQKDTLKSSCWFPQELEEYLKWRGQRHDCYKAYSKVDRVKFWLKEESVFLSRGSKWNDTVDRKALNSSTPNEEHYALCLSFSEQESVAMWMLYGGIRNEGAMVDFTNAAMRQILAFKEKIELGNWENGKFKPCQTIDPGDYSLKITDVLYVADSKKDENAYRVRRGIEVCEKAKKTIVDSTNCVKKAYPWNYENECRLILSVDRSHIKTKDAAVAKIHIKGLYDSVKKGNRIYQSPNCAVENQFRKSVMDGKIEWDLCRDCAKVHNQNREQNPNKKGSK